jgi:hypothetical protein
VGFMVSPPRLPRRPTLCSAAACGHREYPRPLERDPRLRPVPRHDRHIMRRPSKRPLTSRVSLARYSWAATCRPFSRSTPSSLQSRRPCSSWRSPPGGAGVQPSSMTSAGAAPHRSSKLSLARNAIVVPSHVSEPAGDEGGDLRELTPVDMNAPQPRQNRRRVVLLLTAKHSYRASGRARGAGVGGEIRASGGSRQSRLDPSRRA